MSISQKILDRFMQVVKDNREKKSKTSLPKTKVDKELENHDTKSRTATGVKDGTGLTEAFEDNLTYREKQRAGSEYEHMDAEELGKAHGKAGKKPASPYKKGSSMHGDYMRGHYYASKGLVNEADKKKVDGKDFAEDGLVNEADKNKKFAEDGLVNEADKVKDKDFAANGLVNEHQQQMKEQSAFSTGLFDGTNGKDYNNPHEEGSKEHKHYHIGHEIGGKTRSKTRGRTPSVPGTVKESNDVVQKRNLSILNKHIPGKGSSSSDETPAQKAYKLGKQHKAEGKPHSNPHSSDSWEHDQYNAGYGH